jgi:hypothetical protein
LKPVFICREKGCGLAGGKWEKIETIITGQLSEKDIAVYVYDSG